MKKIFEILRKNKILILILTVALLLRFIGAFPGYNRFHSDEGMSYMQGMYIIKEGTLDAHGYSLPYAYPSLIPLINAVFFKLFFLPVTWGLYFLQHIPDIISRDLRIPLGKDVYDRVFQLEILGHHEEHVLFWGRMVSALVGFGVVVFTYLLSSLMFKRSVALLSALLITLNFRHVLNSHINLPDIYNSLFLLISLFFSYRITKNPAVRNYLLAAFFCGVSISTKFQVTAIIPLLIAHFYVSVLNEKLDVRKIIKGVFNIRTLIVLLLPVLVLVVMNPYHIVHYKETLKQLEDVSLKYGTGAMVFSLSPISYLYHIAVGQILSILFIGGVLVMSKKDLKTTFFIISPLIYTFFIFNYYTQGGFYVRNYVSIIPIILIISSYFLIEVFNYFTRTFNKSFAILIFVTLLSVSIFEPAKNSVINSFYYSKPWNYIIIKERVDQVVRDNKVIVASHPFDPLPEKNNYKRAKFDGSSSYSLSEFREENATHALINMDWASNYFYWWIGQRLPESLKYWEKPYSLLRGGFYSLTIEEMMNYTLTSAYKPWQAPEAALFFVKVPYEPKQAYRLIKKYTFDQSMDGWFLHDRDKLSNIFVRSKEVGFDNPGSLQVKPTVPVKGLTRFISDSIIVKEGRSYKVSAKIKAGDSVPQEKRSGFLRIDFYYNENYQELGQQFSLSSRYYGDNWKDISAFGVAPEGVKNLRVSFQISDNTESDLWLDDVIIEESTEEVENYNNGNKMPFDEYKDLLFPFSHGNM
ncbi:MAG: phospholipid carrier-dependent glycosyltransferase [Candidatus Daviesbacteria bacterium]|nr:phospholipid carrier-dependent glycosyltransferase [Candidatus Daviesbacteria bacterium]